MYKPVISFLTSGITAVQMDIASAGLGHPLLAGHPEGTTKVCEGCLVPLKGGPPGDCNVEEHEMLTTCGAGPRPAR